MRLYEYESKALLGSYGVPIPKGIFVERGMQLLQTLGIRFPSMLKAQVPTGGRGKVGGVVKVKNLEEANLELKRIFSLVIGGYPVNSVLIEDAVETSNEYYLSFLVDRSERCYFLLVGTSGGMDIEETARKDPASILRIKLSPLKELSESDIKGAALHLQIDMALLYPLIKRVYSCFLDHDAELLEINPLGMTVKGLLALDAKMVIDDNALFRQPLIQKLKPRGQTLEEVTAQAAGLSYVSLSGNVGIIGNGAGLTMATMDLVKEKGGEAANFLDLGAGARSERMTNALLLLERNQHVKGILINIFGGMTRCDEIARGIIEAICTVKIEKPIVVRLIGTNEEEGENILRKAGITPYKDPLKAAEMIVSLVGST